MAYDGRAVTNFVLDLCEQRQRDVTNLSLQKVVYFCHVWSLIELHRPLVRHMFEAWEFGPVLPYLYREFKAFDRSSITARATEINRDTGLREVVRYSFDPDAEALLLSVADFYSRVRSGDLVELSHAVGGPWYRAWNHRGTVNPGMQIDNRMIVEFYSKAVRPFSMQ